MGTGHHRTVAAAAAAASVFDIEAFAAAAVVVVVQWLPVVHSVSVVDRQDTQPSVGASAPISVLFACASACPVRVLVGELFRDVALASLPKMSELHAPSPA